MRAVALGAFLARAALTGVRAAAIPALDRTNFRGRTVSLAGGPALAVSASASAALGAGSRPLAGAALVAGLGAGAVGLYDDVVGGRPEHQAKGFRGHLSALREGRVTSGLAKIVGVGAAGLAAAALLPGQPAPSARFAALKPAVFLPRSARREPAPGLDQQGGAGQSRRRRAAPAHSLSWRGAVNTLLGAGVIAGTANLVNLLDLRPGRALKAGVLIGAPLGGVAAGPVGAAAALLPADLGEEIMLGDAGANALGALLGVALAARTGPVGRALLLAGLAGLTAASEKVSFTKVIESTPGLRELDALGRRAP
ncbi:MAG: hypothetical protein AUI10_04530 [Actinobacteria bacterium 13_2_20CM_2_72_6]|nr:MAG: hypothetical protein AUI10_04530 [Actinobacteria bacterium 13_2_20CM_2_72_6]